MFNYNTCAKCYHVAESYGRLVPACGKCGYPELKDSGEEWARSLGVYKKPYTKLTPNQIGQVLK